MSTPCSDTLTHPQHPGFSDGVTGLPPPVTVVFPFKRVAKSSSARISGLGLASSGICTGQPVIALECRGANPFPTWNTSPQKACCIVGYRRRYIMIHHDTSHICHRHDVLNINGHRERIKSHRLPAEPCWIQMWFHMQHATTFWHPYCVPCWISEGTRHFG